ncbi:uncharacterized protein LOC143174803 [Nomia melanderi]|uniref:uncharacterized protein LOC143174803 n=1 Tax=Nomia melanderi TaxID=2448451 RepID=UPI003FCD8745
MTVPRVQPLDRLPDNEPGRCSDSAGRRPGYVYEDRSSLPPCRFQPVERVHEPPGAKSVALDVALYDVSLACLEPSVCIDELPSFCSQFGGCSVNSSGPSASRNCQLGPVDLEDLALCFEPEKSQTVCPPPRSPANSSQYRRVRAKYSQYPNSLLPTEKPLAFTPAAVGCQGNVDFDCAGWLDDRFCNSCPQNFDFCTEERWLECPASDRCPLYDVAAYPAYGPHIVPPCVYEDFRNDYWRYGYEDEQQLEDYL